ncbi:LD-carboxypeptidase [Sphingomonas sp.]|uniref:LD-carboxypeptidase n=1 Tax=Sphingomonas sp. TaxID=28214 RepID=UPI001D47B3C9|nr:LD-carboxypeptidase [Sphingomonas sp.]MBX9797241.1 LD-carboxypeptidase [Sphingomonas sp.]
MRIGVVAPAKSIDPALADSARVLAANRFPGVELVIDPQCYLSDGHFAGPDATRADAFVAMANDPAIDAIWFARGGYGSGRILAAALPRLTKAAERKTYMGYSDMGFLLGALYARRLGRVAHGPMLGDLAREGGGAAAARALAWLARGDRSSLEGGLGTRPAAAFNLAILAALCGTPWLPDLADHVLLVEDVSEPLYRVDRLLFQLAHATQLKGVAGVRLGRVSDIQPNDPPWREPLDMMIRRWCAEMGVPYLGPADIGHDVDNKVVPFGLA